ncbi:hypothetical protein V6N13_105096 [Hibiscus sabdariffa]
MVSIYSAIKEPRFENQCHRKGESSPTEEWKNNGNYDYDAPIDEYGLWSEPKWGHLKDLNAAIKLCERALVAVDSPQYMKLGPNQEAHVYWENAYSTGLNTSLLKVKARVLHFLQILMSIIQQQ